MARLSEFDRDVIAYIELCKAMREQPVCDRWGVNPYCEHARKLRSAAARMQQGSQTFRGVNPALCIRRVDD